MCACGINGFLAFYVEVKSIIGIEWVFIIHCYVFSVNGLELLKTLLQSYVAYSLVSRLVCQHIIGIQIL